MNRLPRYDSLETNWLIVNPSIKPVFIGWIFPGHIQQKRVQFFIPQLFFISQDFKFL